MTFPKARLVVSAILFLGWLGFLLYLVLDSSTIILSRPQFLIAQVYVIAEMSDDTKGVDPRVKIDEVLWSADPKDAKLTSQTIVLPELTLATKDHGWEGPGKYILPLQKG